MPSEPVESGCSARIARPAAVSVGRRRVDDAAERLDHDLAVRLLVVRRADLPDLAVEPELRAGERERGAPLARAGLGGQPADARLLVVVRLRHRGVRLVRAGRRRRPRTCSRCAPAYRAPSPAGAPDTAATAATAGTRRAPRRGCRCSDRSLTSCAMSSIGNSGARSSGPTGCKRAGMQDRRRRRRQIGEQVVPLGRLLGSRPAGSWFGSGQCLAWRNYRRLRLPLEAPQIPSSSLQGRNHKGGDACPRSFWSAPNGVMRARARPPICSAAESMRSSSSTAATTPATRSSSVARSTHFTCCRRAS